ncbi:MAG: efflux RND transporter permease subunit [Halobacteriovoraceae bacterium]|nr:efflux RND transporter permease subunit [Halobacteriovoraceae bacterium]
MKGIINYFIERSLLVNLLTFIILVVGIFSIFSLQKETFPAVEFDVILITTTYKGSSSEDVEKLVSIPIERVLKGTSGIKRLNVLSAEGRSIVYIEVDPDFKLDDVLEDTKNAIDTITDLPDDVDAPIVTSLTNKQKGVLNIALVGEDYLKIRSVAKALRDKIEEYKKVAIVQMEGYNKDEISVEVDPDKLNQYQLTMGEVAKSISDRNLNLSSGNIKTKNEEIMVRVISEFVTVKDIEEVVIRSNDSGQKVKVLDVAKVTRKPEEGDFRYRAMGKNSIFLNVKINETADIIKSTEHIKGIVKEQFLDPRNNGVKYNFADDLSYYVKRRLNILKDNGLIGIVLVFSCLLLFLNFRTSLVTSLGAPVAFMVSFICMDFLGVSLNLISMFGLILVLGMLVDDSIIVAEQFYQKLEHGMNPKKAAKEAALETVRPVLATVLTTMVAFGSLFFMGGIMGKFLWSVPAVVIICLSASFFECFFILPSHLADFCHLSVKHQGRRWYDKISLIYELLLKKILKHPYIMITCFFITFIISAIVGKSMNFELFPGDDVRIVFVQIKGPVGNSLDVTDMKMRELESIVIEDLKKEEFEQVTTRLGMLRGEHGNKTGTHYASMTLYLTPPDERLRSTDKIIDDLTKKIEPIIGKYILSVKKVQGGPPKGRPVAIDLKSTRIEDLQKASKNLLEKLKKEEGITTAEIDFEEGKQQIVINVDDEEAKRLGLDTKSIALELRRALAGDPITEIRESDEDIDITLSFNEKSKENLDFIDKIFILNSKGMRIPINKVIKKTSNPGAFVIRRYDYKRVFTIYADIDKRKTTPLKIEQTFKDEVKKEVQNFNEMTFSFGGENEDTKESMSGLRKSAIIAILAIFFILVAIFTSLGQPLVIMSTIPLGMIGVVFTFKIMGIALGFMAFMGIVGLIGVVVNDSIVLVNSINIQREKIKDLKGAIRTAARSRFRPIILTTVTTVAGLLPIAHSPGGDPFLKPMAVSFAYGLLFATGVTLIFIPCAYYAYVKITEFSAKILKKIISIRI